MLRRFRAPRPAGVGILVWYIRKSVERRRWPLYAGFAGGAAAAAGGLLLWLAASSENASANQAEFADDRQRLGDDARSRALAANVLFGAAAASAAAGVVVYVAF